MYEYEYESTVCAHVVGSDHARTLVVRLHGRLRLALQVLLLAQVQQQVRAQVRPVHVRVARRVHLRAHEA